MTLTGAQRRGLDVMRAANHGRAYVSNITTHEHGGCVASATATALEGMGLVVRFRNHSELELTDEGRALCAELEVTA